jgi:hypothetical protein
MYKAGWILGLLLTGALVAGAATTMNETNSFAYSANTGWINLQGDITNGMIIGEYVCSGYMYGANIGWINLGSGLPTNGIQYGNGSADDFGVNVEGEGLLRGYAYGANIGWIAFETNGDPRVDIRTGNLDGYAYGANIGWINLSNLYAYTQTDQINPGADTDGDGIADAWELSRAADLNFFTHTSEHDGDGYTDYDEYLAGTEPLDAGSYLAIVDSSRTDPDLDVSWAATNTRMYVVEQADDVEGSGGWTDVGGGLIGPTTNTEISATISDATNETSIIRVRAQRPLIP